MATVAPAPVVVQGYDTTGDGRVDAVDTTGDGRPDTTIQQLQQGATVHPEPQPVPEATTVTEPEEKTPNKCCARTKASWLLIVCIVIAIALSACIGALSKYGTNPSANWKNTSCYVVGPHSLTAVCTECDTKRDCGLVSSLTNAYGSDGYPCNRRRRRNWTAPPPPPPTCTKKEGTTKKSGYCTTYDHRMKLVDVRALGTDIESGELLWPGTRPANKCGPEVTYSVTSTQGKELHNWLNARVNKTVSCWYHPKGTVDSISGASVKLAKECDDLNIMIKSLIIVCIVFLCISVCAISLCCVCAFKRMAFFSDMP